MLDTMPFGLRVVGRQPEPSPEPEPDPPERDDRREHGIVLYAPLRVHAITRHDELPRPEIEIWPAEVAEPYDSRLVLLSEPDSPRARGFELLRHRLLRIGDPHVIAVTSALAGEGKTTTALNLAHAIANERSASALLVEVNVRAPALSEILGFRPPVCFFEQLTGREIDDHFVVAHLVDAGFHYLGVDPRVVQRWSAQQRAFDRERLKRAIVQLRRVYDYVIIDTPAALDSPGASLLSDVADGILITVRAQRSRARYVEKLLEQLEPAPILGIALLDASRRLEA